MCLRLAVSYFLLRHSSEFWAYANGQVHLRFSLTPNCLTCFHGRAQVAFEDRWTASAARVNFVASKYDQNRTRCSITRTRLKR